MFDVSNSTKLSVSISRMASCIQNLAFDDIVVSTGTLSQADSGTTTTKCKGRQPRSRNKKTLQREAAIAGAMQALQAGGTQGQRDEALQALQADKMVAHKLKMMSVLRKVRSVAASWLKG